MPFNTKGLKLDLQEDGKTYILRQVLTYATPDGKRTIVVPEGFVTDMASVPRGFWNLFPPVDRYARAAVIHDFLYERRGGIGEAKLLSRAQCDWLFLVAMEELGIPWWQRNLMWVAVRAGGRHAWNT